MNDVIVLMLCVIILGFCYWLVVVKCYIIRFQLYRRFPDIHLDIGRVGKLVFFGYPKNATWSGKDFRLDTVRITIEREEAEIDSMLLPISRMVKGMSKAVVEARFETCRSEAMIVLK